MIEVSSTEQVVFKDYPLGVWLTGIAALVLGVVIPDRIWERILFVVIAFPFIGFVPILTVTVDPMREALQLRYRSLFRVSTRVFSFSEIYSANVREDWEK